MQRPGPLTPHFTSSWRSHSAHPQPCTTCLSSAQCIPLCPGSVQGLSGRALRKLPFQAHAFFIQVTLRVAPCLRVMVSMAHKLSVAVAAIAGVHVRCFSPARALQCRLRPPPHPFPATINPPPFPNVCTLPLVSLLVRRPGGPMHPGGLRHGHRQRREQGDFQQGVAGHWVLAPTPHPPHKRTSRTRAPVCTWGHRVERVGLQRVS